MMNPFNTRGWHFIAQIHRFSKNPPQKKMGSTNRFLSRGLLLGLLLSIISVAKAQEITIDFTDAPLVKVMKEIKSQSKYELFYNQELLEDTKPITIKADKEPLLKLLNRLFEPLPLNYSIANNTIVIMPRKKVGVDEPVGNSPFFVKTEGTENMIKGRVVDHENKPVAGIIVQYDQSYFYAYTNKDGDFSIPGGNGTMINFSGNGYADNELRYAGEGFLLVHMEPAGVILQDVMVLGAHKDPTLQVDLTNRSYMNLGQVLQGTVPGLSLQTTTTTSKKIISVRVVTHDLNGQVFATMSEEQFLKAYPSNGQAILDALLSGNIPSWLNTSVYSITTTTMMTNTIVPQIRGNNNFTSNTQGMLVVIDGFVRDGFPADYPMANVESIEVVKDPKELLKWGAKAAGGLIIVKSKSAKGGRLQFNYSTNMYYQPAPRYDRAKQQLAPVATYLDYTRESDSLYGGNYTGTPFNISPAKYLLWQHRQHSISEDQFNTSWDSLKLLDNESQMRMLQRNAFNMSHNLSVMGGNDKYRFSFMGSYTDNQGNEIKSYNRMLSLNLNNTFNLLKKKMRIDWLLTYMGENTRTGTTVDPNNLGVEPYQMLVNAKGDYVYDQTALNKDGNQKIMNNGYLNYGVNILQNANVNKSTSDNGTFQSRFNMRWNILPNLTMFTSFLYKGVTTKNKDLYGKESSYVRQIVDQYGNLTPTGVNFYVPYGDILKSNSKKDKEWNVRTALGYSKVIGKSDIKINIGAGAASTASQQPANAIIYGYNSATGLGTPIYLPTPSATASISNFYSLFNSVSTVSPYSLLTPLSGDTSNSRNVNVNAGLRYGYGDRFSVSGSYTAVYNPVYGQNSKYSTLSNYGGDISEIIVKKSEHSFLHNLAVSVGLTGYEMPDLPVQYLNTRTQQTLWGNYTVWVSGTSPTQQVGQKSLNYYQRLTASLADGRYQLSVGYNTQNISNLRGVSGKTDSASTLRYLSADVKTFLRNGLFTLSLGMNKSPEGSTQFNGNARYDIAKETYFHARNISSLFVDFTLQNVSPYQGLSTMMGTNALDEQNGGFSMATNNTFNSLPPKNKNYEARGHLGVFNDRYTLDLRYYNHTTSGLTNSITAPADASTGMSSQVAYSDITNKGVEFFLKNTVIQKQKFSYTITLNGAYNVNIANNVPKVAFSVNNNYQSIYREGYSTSNLWSYKWAGLDNKGNPQIYNASGKITSNLDSATLASSMVYSGVMQAPWTGGFIQDVRLGSFFARASLVFNFGFVMRRYIPVPSSASEQSILIKDRWKKAGDELYTDVPAFSLDGDGTSRAFITKNSTNSIMPGDNVRLSEVMIGWSAKPSLIARTGLKSLTFTLQGLNMAVWTKNKLHLDPTTVSSSGVVSLSVPKQLACSLNLGF